MRPDHLSIKAIFGHAIEIENDVDRRAYLDQACADQPELRQRVDLLLGAYDQAGDFLERPVIDLSPTSSVLSAASQVGQTIGPYKLLQQIGEGGMGTVYMAEQTKPVVRKVALKIIKPGMDSRRIIARFEAERQALALMDHPNVARILDAGATDSGRPYFVMELVKGIPIIQYCDQCRLPPRQRLELFAGVCQAVQHAHQKGIIHRDLKPSNILIADYDDKPVAKVIDFGVAKAVGQQLTEQTVFTEFGQIIGTIEYMSPEQAKLNQLDIDTRTDIYSLGVLLYELLTGEPPFDRQRLRSAAFDEMLRIIREEEPPRPSTRLGTSASLPSIAANRQLEPKKLATTIAGDLDWIVMRALEKERSRRYQTAGAIADDIDRYLVNQLVEARPPSGAYRLRKFAQRNRSLIFASGLIAVIVLVAAITSTILYLRERIANADAVAARGKAHDEAVRSQELVSQLGNRLWSLGDTLVESGHREEAERIFTDAVHNFDKAVADAPDVEYFRQEQAISELKLGQFLGFDHRMAEAETHLRKSIRGYAALRKTHPNNRWYFDEEVNCIVVLADAFLSAGQTKEAHETFGQAIDMLRARAEAGDDHAQDRLGGLYGMGKGVEKNDLEALKWIRRAADQGNVVSQNSVGVIYDQGLGVPADPAEAARWYQRAVDQDYNEARVWLGHLYAQGRGVPKDARRANALYHDAVERFRKDIVAKNVHMMNTFAWVLANERDTEVRDPQTAIEMAQKALAVTPKNGDIWNTLGVAQYRAGNFQAAISVQRKSIEMRKGGDAYDFFFLAMALQQSHQPDEARQWYEKGLASMAEKFPRNPELIRFRAEVAEVLGLPIPPTITRPSTAPATQP
jgi:serine/threonine protein kinase